MENLLFTVLGIAIALAGWAIVQRFWSFHAQRPEDYDGLSPAFDIRRHLDGPILCEGVIYGPTGRVASRFVADMEAQWDGSTGTMREHFRYDDGTTQERCWQLTVDPGGAIRAEAPDLVGTGQGAQKGAGVCLRYRIRLPEASGGHVLDTTDWMYLMENGAIINRSEFRKFGIKVAELVATMRRKDARDSSAVAAE